MKWILETLWIWLEEIFWTKPTPENNTQIKKWSMLSTPKPLFLPAPQSLLPNITLAIWCKELTHLKRPWWWERLKVGGEGDDRGWDSWMASPTYWTWLWVNSGSWWWTGRPGVLGFMGLQRVGHNWVTELKTELVQLRERLRNADIRLIMNLYSLNLYSRNLVGMFVFLIFFSEH